MTLEQVREFAYKQAFSFCRNQENAEDIAQNIVILYLTNENKIINEKGWITKCCKNKILEQKRVQEIQKKYRGRVEQHLYTSPISPDASYEDKKTLSRVRKSIFSLNKADQDILLKVLSYEGKKKNLALELGISLGAFKGKLYRIRKELKGKLLVEDKRSIYDLLS